MLEKQASGLSVNARSRLPYPASRTVRFDPIVIGNQLVRGVNESSGP